MSLQLDIYHAQISKLFVKGILAITGLLWKFTFSAWDCLFSRVSDKCYGRKGQPSVVIIIIIIVTIKVIIVCHYPHWGFVISTIKGTADEKVTLKSRWIIGFFCGDWSLSIYIICKNEWLSGWQMLSVEMFQTAKKWKSHVFGSFMIMVIAQLSHFPHLHTFTRSK